MTLGGFGLAFLAGLLSILSPCVLPLLPIVVGAAASEHRFGPAALAAGLAASFVAVGLFVATIGFSIGLDAGVFRTAAAILMILIGAILTVPKLQARFALAAGPLGDLARTRLSAVSTTGIGGQFSAGLALGAVWSPCAGPTLGAASILAAQGRNLGEVAMTMFLFGLGAAAPLLAIGLLSREAFTHWRGRFLLAGQSAKIAFGGLFVAIGLAIVSGLDKKVETFLVEMSPQWLTDLTSRF
jgi:cytochrome c biogenesis protein CcdA